MSRGGRKSPPAAATAAYDPAVSEAVSIPGRFNGPPATGHGGYSCAVAAQFIDGPAEVTLRRPPPLERSLAVRRDGDAVQLLDGDFVVAEAHAHDLELELPQPVGVDEAEQAARRSPLFEFDPNPFARCFVCGTDRQAGDGLRLFSGPVQGRDVFAVPWTPGAELADADGAVRDEFVWSVLDCPSGSAAMFLDGPRVCVLARYAVRPVAPVRTGEQHVVVGWPIAQDRRKHSSGAAVFTAGGEPRAFARALWVELTDAQLEGIGVTGFA
jgi:hypothetical protein